MIVPAGGVAGDALLNGLVEDQGDGLGLTQPQRPSQGRLQMIQDYQPQDAVIADHFAHRPALGPALFAVLVRRPTVRAFVRRPCLLQPLAQSAEQAGQMVQKGGVVNPTGARLLLGGPSRPAFEQEVGVALDDRGDLHIALGPDDFDVGGHGNYPSRWGTGRHKFRLRARPGFDQGSRERPFAGRGRRRRVTP